MLYFSSEFTCILQYVSLATIAALEGKMLTIVTSAGNYDYDAKPLKYMAIRAGSLRMM